MSRAICRSRIGVRWLLQHAARHTFCIYTKTMELTWSERKRSLNLKQHGLDFLDAVAVFEGLTFTYE